MARDVSPTSRTRLVLSFLAGLSLVGVGFVSWSQWEPLLLGAGQGFIFVPDAIGAFLVASSEWLRFSFWWVLGFLTLSVGLFHAMKRWAPTLLIILVIPWLAVVFYTSYQRSKAPAPRLDALLFSSVSSDQAVLATLSDDQFHALMQAQVDDRSVVWLINQYLGPNSSQLSSTWQDNLALKEQQTYSATTCNAIRSHYLQSNLKHRFALLINNQEVDLGMASSCQPLAPNRLSLVYRQNVAPSCHRQCTL